MIFTFLNKVTNVYFGTLKKKFKADIPKRVITFLVKKSIEDIRGQIQRDLLLENEINDLVKEDEETTRKREVIENKIRALEDSQVAIRLVSGNKKTSFDKA